MQTKTNGSKLLATITALAGAFAVIAQLYSNIVINKAGLSVTEHLLRFFTFFTILTNILVTICCACIAAGAKNFFTKANVLNATVVYITIVGIIYNVVLRGQFVLVGMDIWLNEILHVVVPALYIIYWVMFVPKNNLHWKDALPWLWYPLIYLIIVLIRGAISDYYPYPFTDVKTIGYGKALLNDFFVTIAFLVISLLFIAIGRLLSKKNND
jgi:hypothetical protein